MPVFCLPGAGSTCPLVTTETCLQSLPNVPGAKSFQDENDLLEETPGYTEERGKQIVKQTVCFLKKQTV